MEVLTRVVALRLILGDSRRSLEATLLVLASVARRCGFLRAESNKQRGWPIDGRTLAKNSLESRGLEQFRSGREGSTEGASYTGQLGAV